MMHAHHDDFALYVFYFNAALRAHGTFKRHMSYHASLRIDCPFDIRTMHILMIIHQYHFR
jgi:hypothetical protein